MKRLPWFRMFYEARNDAKLRTLSDQNFRIWFNLLCLAAEQGDRGEISGEKYPGDLLAIEVAAGDEVCLNEALYSLERLRIISRDDDGITFIHFMERQYDKPSDYPENTRARKQKERDNRVMEEPVTPLSRDVTPNHAQEKIRIEEIREEEKRETPPTPSKGNALRAAVPNAPFRLFARFCEEADADESSVPPGEKGKQLGIAKAILAEYSEDEAIACAAYLRSQSWRTGLIDLGTVKSEIGKWKLGGSPAQERARAPTNGSGSQHFVTKQEQIDENNRIAETEFLGYFNNGSNGNGPADVQRADEPPRRRLSH